MWSQNGGRFSTAYIRFIDADMLWCVLRVRNHKIDRHEENEKQTNNVEFPWALDRPICTQLCQPENALCCFIWSLRVFAHHWVLREIDEIVIKLMGAGVSAHFKIEMKKFLFYFVTGCGYTFSTNHSSYSAIVSARRRRWKTPNGQTDAPSTPEQT